MQGLFYRKGSSGLFFRYIEVVCSMDRSDFYKSMMTYASSQVWQDVYCPETPAGIAYVKITLRQDGSVVIQFKEK